MIVNAGSVDVTSYFSLRLTASGLEATGLTVTSFDLQYVRSGVAPSTKVDASALAATDTAHTDNAAIEIDATDQPGLYRVDWPDAAFAAGVREVILSVKCATAFTEHLRVELSPAVNVEQWNATAVPAEHTAGYPVVTVKDGAGTGEINTNAGKVVGVELVDTLTIYTGNTPQTGDVFPLASTEIADIKAKTDALPTDPADQSLIIAATDAIMARLGLPVGASVSADIAAIEAQTDDIGAAGAGLTAVPWNPAWDAEVQSEVQDALEANNLDHLVKLAVDTDFATTVHLDSVVGQLADNGTAATFDRTTDSLEALRDRGDVAWTTGTTPPTVGAIADAVWDETLADHLAAGTTGNALNAAGAAGDPWTTALPGAYGAGTAGNIVGNRLDVAVGSRLATAGYTAPPSVGAIADQVWEEPLADHLGVGSTGEALDAAGAGGGLDAAGVRAAVGLAAANLDTQLSGIQADTDNIQTRLPAALVAGRMDAHMGSVADAVLTAAKFAAGAFDAVWSVAARILTAGTNIVLAKGVGVTGFNDLSAAQVNAEVDTALVDYDGPTGAELISEIDAVQAQITALNNLSAAQVNAEIVDALSIDTYAEPGQGTPASTLSLAAKINYLFKAWRNRHTQTATQYTLYDAAGVIVDQKATFSSDGTTADRETVATGP